MEATPRTGQILAERSIPEMKAITVLKATTWLVAVASLAFIPGARAATLDPGRVFSDEAARSKERAAELYAAALQLVAGDFVDSISSDSSRALLNALEAPGAILPEGRGSLDANEIRRFRALGLRAAAADGQLAVWVLPGDLRNNVGRAELERASERLRLGMVGRIGPGGFRQDGVPVLPIRPALADRLPESAYGVVVGVRSPADTLTAGDGVAMRRQPCPDGQYGFGIREERPYHRSVTGDGQATLAWTGPWRSVSVDCQAESERHVVAVTDCPNSLPGWVTHRVRQQIRKHPDNPFLFQILQEPAGPQNEQRRNCGGSGKRFDSRTTTETDRTSRPCHAVHAPAGPPAEPPYSGTVHYEWRFRVVTSRFLDDDGNSVGSAVRRRYPIDPGWREVSDTCSRIFTRTVSRQLVPGCPASHPRGVRYQTQSGVETVRDVRNTGEERLSVVWTGDPVETTNTCHRVWTRSGPDEFRTAGCDRYRRLTTEVWSEFHRTGNRRLDRTSAGAWVVIGRVPNCGGSRKSGTDRGDNNGNRNGDGRREEPDHGWDVDGDGVADYHSEIRAHEVMDTLDIDGRPNRIHDGCSSSTCSGLTNRNYRNDENGDDNNDDDDSNNCFLTTAVVDQLREADDGPTLTALRRFRDGWLASTADGRRLIAEYELLAPRIVAAIPPGHEDWRWIAQRIERARDLIAAGSPVGALSVYRTMVTTLEGKWL
ncbi:MAG: hypothetical protein OXI81_02115 [Paracoccaceae bacterium]|nr:hypothetical protein [Paracoccaceae bacterium]